MAERHRAALGTVLLVVMTSAACDGGDGPAVESTGARPSSPRVTRTFDGPGSCNDTGGAAACAAGFTIDGVFHAISCGPVRPDAVTDDVIATGTYNNVRTELRRLADVDPALLLAIRLDGGACADGDRTVSPWSMVFPGDATTRPELRDAICAVTFEAYRERNLCPAGA